MVTKRFVNDGLQIRELECTLYCDFLLRPPRAADLIFEFPMDFRMGENQVCSGRQQASRGLAASDYDICKIHVDLLPRQPFLVVVAQDIRHEIRAIRFHVQAAIDDSADIGPVLITTADNTCRSEDPQQTIERREAHGRADEDHGFDGVHNSLDPWVVFVVLETVEGLAKREIAYDINGEPVEPLYKINLSCGVLAELVYERIDVIPNERFLFSERFVREGMSEDTAYPRVVGIVGYNQAFDTDVQD